MKPTLPNISMKLYIPLMSACLTKYRGSSHDTKNSTAYVAKPTRSNGTMRPLSGIVSPITDERMRHGHETLMMKFDSLRSKSPPVRPHLFDMNPATTSSSRMSICVMMLSISF